MNDAQRAELDEIAASNGGVVHPKKVVAFAANKKSALHGEFTWDDKEAGQRLREMEARQLIRVYVRHVPSIQRRARAYISVPSDRANGDGYRSVEKVLENPSLVSQMVDEVRKRITSLSESYSYLRFMDGLWPRLLNEVDRYLEESKAKHVA